MLCGDLNGKGIQKSGSGSGIYVWLILFSVQ